VNGARHHTTRNARVRALGWAVLAALLALTGSALLAAHQEQAPVAAPQEHAAQAPSRPAQPAPETAGEHAAGSGWLATIGKFFNFLVLAGVLVYYLRAPIANYLSRRSFEIRGDLAKAAETRQAASAELSAIEQKMKALPGEIESLKSRGAREVASEEARIRAAAENERERLLEQARREIDLQVKAAERDLIKRAAELSVGLAAERIRQTITDTDQARLVDRYLADVSK